MKEETQKFLEELKTRALPSTAGHLKTGGLNGPKTGTVAKTHDEMAAALEALVRAGEEGGLWCVGVDLGEEWAVVAVTGNGPDARANAEFFACARNDLLRLARVVEEQDQMIQKLREALEAGHFHHKLFQPLCRQCREDRRKNMEPREDQS
jgi:hypothetical protein